MLNISHKIFIFRYKLRVFLVGGVSLRKFYNFLLNKFEAHIGRAKLTSYPVYATIELLNYCNLKCPHCAIGSGLSKRKKGYMIFEKFKSIIDQMDKYLIEVFLGPNGEPFLNNDVFEIIKYLDDKKIYSLISSNFNLSDTEHIDKILESKLKEIGIAIDGTSNETYSHYRRGGNFNNAIDNLTLLIRKRNKTKSKFPFVIWQFLVMKHNEHEVEYAKNLAKIIGVNYLNFNIGFIPLADYWYFGEKEKTNAEQWFPKNDEFKLRNVDSFIINCRLPYKEIHVLLDGSVVPCCRLAEKNIALGNIFNNKFETIWNNEKFQYFRKQLINQGKNTNCLTCLNNIKVFFENERGHNNVSQEI